MSRLLKDPDRESKTADRFLVRLAGPLVDQTQRGAASTLRAKEKSPDSAGSETHLLADQKCVALGNEKNFVNPINEPLTAACRILWKFDCYFGAERYFDKGAIVLFAKDEIAHICTWSLAAFGRTYNPNRRLLY